MSKTATKADNGTATAVTEPEPTIANAPTFLDLFRAREHLAQLKQMQFPPRTAVKVWRILKRLDNDLLPMIQQYERLVIKYGAAVESEPGMVKVSYENVVKFNQEFEPLLDEPLTCGPRAGGDGERLTLDELGNAETAVSPALLDAIWFILDSGE